MSIWSAPRRTQAGFVSSLKNLVRQPQILDRGFYQRFYSGAMSLVMAGMPVLREVYAGHFGPADDDYVRDGAVGAIGAVGVWAYFVRRV